MNRLLITLTATAALAAPAVASADTTITSFPGAGDGLSVRNISDRPTDLPAVGQVVTVPAGEEALAAFTLRLYGNTLSRFHGAVYDWDGDGPAGAARWTGGTRALTKWTQHEDVVFDTGGLPVEPGDELLLVLAASPTGPPPSATMVPMLRWTGRGPSTDHYAGGRLALVQSQVGDLASAPWATFGDSNDLAFSATFTGDGVEPEPEPDPEPTPQQPPAGGGGGGGPVVEVPAGPAPAEPAAPVVDAPSSDPVPAAVPAPAPACTVPALTGLKVQAARERLRAAGCRLGDVTRRALGRTVTRQSTRAGAVVARDAQVSVTVGRRR